MGIKIRIPLFKRIYKSDYEKDQQDLIEKLSFSINVGMENFQGVLNNRTSLQDNIQCTLKTFNVTVDSSGKPTTTSAFTLTSLGTLSGIIVLNAVNQTNSTVYPTGTPFISFSVNSNLVSITNIAGLPAGNNFLITVVAFTN